MRTRKANRVHLKDKVIEFLAKQPNKIFNISEISRAVEKAPPTITKVVEELEKENRVLISNKKSMRLVSLRGEMHGSKIS
jgi:predicted transcriptional regulator with HTH domain